VDLLMIEGRISACCVHMDSRNPLYSVVFRASSHVQMIPSERDLLVL
jgi:hypothetical protein